RRRRKGQAHRRRLPARLSRLHEMVRSKPSVRPSGYHREMAKWTLCLRKMRPTMAETLPVPIGLPGSISPHDQALDPAPALAAAANAQHPVRECRRRLLALTESCAANQECALTNTIEPTSAHHCVMAKWTLCLRKMRPTMAETLPVPIGLPGSISPHDQAL